MDVSGLYFDYFIATVIFSIFIIVFNHMFNDLTNEINKIYIIDLLADDVLEIIFQHRNIGFTSGCTSNLSEHHIDPGQQ